MKLEMFWVALYCFLTGSAIARAIETMRPAAWSWFAVFAVFALISYLTALRAHEKALDKQEAQNIEAFLRALENAHKNSEKKEL